MKTALIIVGLLLLAGCNPAAQLDQEYSKATQQVQDQQVAYPDAPFAKQTPEGMEGITAEAIMNTANKTYAVKETKTEFFTITEDSSSGSN